MLTWEYSWSNLSILPSCNIYHLQPPFDHLIYKPLPERKSSCKVTMCIYHLSGAVHFFMYSPVTPTPIAPCLACITESLRALPGISIHMSSWRRAAALWQGVSFKCTRLHVQYSGSPFTLLETLKSNFWVRQSDSGDGSFIQVWEGITPLSTWNCQPEYLQSTFWREGEVVGLGGVNYYAIVIVVRLPCH